MACIVVCIEIAYGISGAVELLEFSILGIYGLPHVLCISLKVYICCKHDFGTLALLYKVEGLSENCGIACAVNLYKGVIIQNKFLLFFRQDRNVF